MGNTMPVAKHARGCPAAAQRRWREVPRLVRQYPSGGVSLPRYDDSLQTRGI